MSYRACAALTQSEALNFYYTFWLLPAERRRSVYAIYAFSRRLDDAVDDIIDRVPPDGSAPSPEAYKQARSELDRMRRLVDGDLPEHEFSAALQDTIEKFDIPRRHFHDLIDGMAMDLDGHEYRTFEDLRLYCYRAASTIGLICVEIFGRSELGRVYPAQTTEPAIDLGIAMQLTNITRDVAEDLTRGRLYLPQEELDRFHVTRDSLRNRTTDDAFRSLMKFQVERAREYFERAEPLFPLLRASSRYCPILLRKFYSELLDKIEANNYDIFRNRPSISRLRKTVLAVSIWIQSLLVRIAD